MADDMTIDLRINPAELAKTLRNLQDAGKAVGLTVQHLVWEVAADAAKDCVKYTPPRTKFGGSFGEQRKVGEHAVISDLEALFKPDDPDPKSKILVFQNEYNNRTYFRPSNRSFADWVSEVPPTRILKTDLEKVHHAHRKPNGRVFNRPPIHLAPRSAIRRYIKAVKARVGELKAGWMPGVEMFCRLARKKVGIPKWITRHTPEGKSLDRMTADGNGYIQIDNLAHHRGAIRKDMIQAIQRKRQEDVEKYLSKRLEKIALRHNAGDATPEAVTV